MVRHNLLIYCWTGLLLFEKLSSLSTFPDLRRCLIIHPEGLELASTQVRVIQYLEDLAARGVRCETVQWRSQFLPKLAAGLAKGNRQVLVSWFLKKATAVDRRLHRFATFPSLLRRARHAEVVVIQKALIRGKYLDRLRAASKRLIYDLDDAVYLPYPDEANALIRAADLTLAGSRAIYEYCTPLARRVVLIPSAVHLKRFAGVSSSSRKATGSLPVVGWIGGMGTVKYLQAIRTSLLGANQALPFELCIAGADRSVFDVAEWAPLTIRCIPEYKNDQIPQILSRFDVGIMPLPDNAATRAKCAYKALLCMAAGVPTISSKVGEIVHIVDDWKNGVLVEHEHQWCEAVVRLLRESTLRRSLAHAGKGSLARYSKDECFKLFWDEVFES